MPRRFRFTPVGWRVLLLPYLVALALIVFLPAREAGRVTGIVGWAADVLASVGVPREPAATALEFGANIVLFVPFGALLALAWPRLGAWSTIGIGAALSVVIELVQLGIPSRVSAVSDVVANTTGTAIGVLLVTLWVQRRQSAAPPDPARSPAA
ncbi:VanZ family protein [Agromyces intestinalis]|uniref:VanZ family protein n=1 Tax=Agromyces intestinalis TaxID=2592652 RepID=A0A5C1YC93_9MICO|nr:VanZ family protein [Agromyces intestinalis]QEO13661.1 VanZ family protein [Agromyces intestinalis]